MDVGVEAEGWAGFGEGGAGFGESGRCGGGGAGERDSVSGGDSGTNRHQRDSFRHRRPPCTCHHHLNAPPSCLGRGPEVRNSGQ